MNEMLTRWGAALNATYSGLIAHLSDWLPELLGALLLVGVGWGVARVARASAVKLSGGLDALLGRFGWQSGVDRVAARRFYGRVIGNTAYWFVFLFFLAVAVNTLGWRVFSGWSERFGSYLPGLFAGLAIILAGVLLGRAARVAVTGAANSVAITSSRVLGRLAEVLVVVPMAMVGVEAAGIDTGVLASLLTIVVGLVFGGVSLAFALGARDLAANAIAVRLARRRFGVGDQLRIGSYRGQIVEITDHAVVIDTGDGRAMIPAQVFLRDVAVLETPPEGGPATTGPGEAHRDQ